MADGAGPPRRNGGSSLPNQHTEWHDERMLTWYAILKGHILKAVTGLGYLALTWSTVVLLGGFVTSLGKKDFWCLTVLSMILAARIVEDSEEQVYMGFAKAVFWVCRESMMVLGARISVMPKVSGVALLATVLFLIATIAALPFMFVFEFVILIVYAYGPLPCVALSSWRLGQRDYGNTDGADSTANMMPALDIFYSLVICQGILFGIWVLIDFYGRTKVIHFHAVYPLSEKWGIESIGKYLSDTAGKCWREPASIKGRNLINYAVGLLGSESPDEYLSGARLLGALVKKGEDVRSLLLCSRPKIQKLIDTLRWRSSPDENREIRELAATIVADLASDIDLAQYPGAIRCISSLLQEETTQTYWNSNQQVPQPQSRRQPVRAPLTRQEHLWQDIQEETEQIRMRAEEQYRQKNMKKEAHYRQRRMKKQDADHVQQQEEEEVDRSSGNDSEGGTYNNLILQGLTILERLASDHQNCMDICSAPGLLPKIMAPIYSNTLIQDISSSGAWANLVDRSFKVLHRLICAPGEGSRRLRLEISSNNQAVSNLEMILDEGKGAGQELQMLSMEQRRELQMRAMEILTELHLDLSTNLSDKTKKKLINKQLRIFLSDKGEQETTPMLKLKATAGRKLVLLSTNSKTNSDAIKSAYDCIIARLTGLPDDDKDTVAHITGLLDGKDTVAQIIELLDAKNNIIYRIIAAKILENLCTHCDLDKPIMKQTLLPKVLTEIPYSKRESPERKIYGIRALVQRLLTFRRTNNEQNQRKSAPGCDEESQKTSTHGHKKETQDSGSSGDQKRSSGQGNEDETATKELQEALLSLTLVILRGKRISADDFDDVVEKKASGHGAFVAKLKTIVEENCQATTADSLRIVKVCGQIAVLMMQRDKYTQHFKNQEFVKSLSEASKLMSNLESCMLFAGTDLGMKKTVKPLLSGLVKEALQLVG